LTSLPGRLAGQNTKSLTGEQPGSKISIDGGLEAFALKREFGIVAPEDVEDHMTHYREV
jgi:hypothetical protein